ncbi:MAG: ATP-binding protein, partial [Dehalococcoidia bacterium]
MPAATVEWRETISRGTAIALMHNFTSVAEALKELVDNAIDYRWGQPLTIEILEDKRHHRVIIESDGGRGMGAEDIQVWLNWGEGEEHEASQIGRYYQGGKAACGFLGQYVKLWAKRTGSNDIWFLEDQDWGVRRAPR